MSTFMKNVDDFTFNYDEPQVFKITYKVTLNNERYFFIILENIELSAYNAVLGLRLNVDSKIIEIISLNDVKECFVYQIEREGPVSKKIKKINESNWD